MSGERMVSLSLPNALGYMVALCAVSGHYSFWTMEGIGRLFIPPLKLGQAKIYLKDGEPVAFATWAFLTEETSKRILSEHIDPEPNEWNAGDVLWLIDFVAPYGNIRPIVADLQSTIFARRSGHAYALKRDGEGRVKKTSKWPTLHALGRPLTPSAHRQSAPPRPLPRPP